MLTRRSPLATSLAPRRSGLGASPARRGASILACTVLAITVSPLSAQPGPDDPLGFLEPLIGTWTGAPEWIADNPGMDRMIPIAFRWGTSRHSILEQSGLPVDGRLFTVGLIAWDPVDRRAEFTASQGNDLLLFSGHYEPIGDGDIQRTYSVGYPDGSVVRFRETFFFDGPDALDWLTEWEQNGEWVPRRGNGDPEFRAQRRRVDTARTATTLSAWEGVWSDPAGGRLEIAPTDGGVGFDVTMTRESGVLVEGLVFEDPYTASLRATLLASDGAVSSAGVETPSATVLEWTLEDFRPDGTIDGWSERWRLEGRCIVRSVIRAHGTESDQRLCRSE